MIFNHQIIKKHENFNFFVLIRRQFYRHIHTICLPFRVPWSPKSLLLHARHRRTRKKINCHSAPPPLTTHYEFDNDNTSNDTNWARHSTHPGSGVGWLQRDTTKHRQMYYKHRHTHTEGNPSRLPNLTDGFRKVIKRESTTTEMRPPASLPAKEPANQQSVSHCLQAPRGKEETGLDWTGLAGTVGETGWADSRLARQLVSEWVREGERRRGWLARGVRPSDCHLLSLLTTQPSPLPTTPSIP